MGIHKLNLDENLACRKFYEYFERLVKLCFDLKCNNTTS